MAAKIENRNIYVSSASATSRASWAPADFGQARMAAIAWTYGLAIREDKGAEKALADRYRTDALKTPADQRTRWDWYYLGLVRNDTKTTHEAAHALSLAGAQDPPALKIYLNTLATRTGSTQAQVLRAGAEAADPIPPLDADELDHILACYDALRLSRPDLVGPTTALSVVNELKRAKRTDDENRLYREALAATERPQQIVTAIYLATWRGDVDALLSLCERYERLQSEPAGRLLRRRLLCRHDQFPRAGHGPKR